MSVFNPKGKVSAMTKTNRCDGCGRILPKGSMALMWSVWSEGSRFRLRFCSDCQSIVYGCKERKPFDVQNEELFVRETCERCDEYPFCGKVEFLKESMPGDLWFGDIPMPEPKG